MVHRVHDRRSGDRGTDSDVQDRELCMRKNTEEDTAPRNGMAILIRILLSLIVPSIVGELALARYAWVHDEKIQDLTMHVTVLNTQVNALQIEIVRLQSKIP